MYDKTMSENNNNNVTPIRNIPAFAHCARLYFRLSFFSASPEQLPCSIGCIIKAIALYCLVNLFLLNARSASSDVLIQVFIELGVLALFTIIGLKIIRKPERFIQTFSALVGIAMVISLISAPIYLILVPDFLSSSEINQTVINITVLLLIWNLAAISHILKRSFEISTLMSAVIAFNYLIVFEVIMVSLSTGNA